MEIGARDEDADRPDGTVALSQLESILADAFEAGLSRTR